ncbi:MAG: hypothetical protein QOF33_5069 [Thermomicrobiales bacterium]|nr:hypothetical protein [Thermomicrobiales bacterium]
MKFVPIPDGVVAVEGAAWEFRVRLSRLSPAVASVVAHAVRYAQDPSRVTFTVYEDAAEQILHTPVRPDRRRPRRIR